MFGSGQPTNERQSGLSPRDSSERATPFWAVRVNLSGGQKHRHGVPDI